MHFIPISLWLNLKKSYIWKARTSITKKRTSTKGPLSGLNKVNTEACRSFSRAEKEVCEEEHVLNDSAQYRHDVSSKYQRRARFEKAFLAYFDSQSVAFRQNIQLEVNCVEIQKKRIKIGGGRIFYCFTTICLGKIRTTSPRCPTYTTWSKNVIRLSIIKNKSRERGMCIHW